MTVIYHRDGKIHSILQRSRPPGHLSDADREQGLEYIILTPEQEQKFSRRWRTLDFNKEGRLIGHDGMPFGADGAGVCATVLRSEQRRVLMISSWQTACGVAEYTRTLRDELMRLGWDVAVAKPTELNAVPAASLVHVQYEPNLYDRELLGEFLDMQEAPCVLTAHYYDDWVANRYMPNLERVITHNPDLPEDEKHTYMVQGCPVFPEKNPVQLRKHYCLPTDKVILSEFGFIMPWKQIDYFFCGYMAPMLKRQPDLYVQLMHAPYPKFPGLTERTQRNILDAVAEFGIEDQVLTFFEMLSKEEINDRLQASDLGYIWGRAESRGSSATTKEFISGRCPVVVPVSPHYADLNKGLVKVPLGGAEEFAQYVERVAFDAEWREHLRREQCENYEAYNYRRVAEKHVEVYQCIG